MGGVSVGVSVGRISVGLLALAGLSVGYWSLGRLALGMFALGGEQLQTGQRMVGLQWHRKLHAAGSLPFSILRKPRLIWPGN